MDPIHPLLTLIDTERAGLEAVHAAVEQSNPSGALNALVKYYRTREEPDTAAFAKPNANAVNAAERVIRREFTFYNEPGTVPHGDWDWTYKPGTDWEWTWALNRHHFWRTLGAAYLATDNERYAQELATQVRTWVGNHPASTDDRSAWRTIEAGIRTAGPWPSILPVMKKSAAFSREVWLYYLRAIYEHAEFLIAHPKKNNWLLMESNGLLTCGLLFPEFRRAAEWVRIGIERFETEMKRQVHPDGAHCEYSTGYIFVAIVHFADACDKVDRVLGAGRGFSQEYRDRVVAMWEHVLYMMRPDGAQPMLNDGEKADIRPRLLTAGKRYSRPDFTYAATNGAEGTPPADASHRFPWVRRVIMRDAVSSHPWAEDALYGFFETAPLGAGHVHEDMLTFEIMAYGQQLIGTMGRFTYEHIPRRIYLVNGQGHNTVLVDGASQKWTRTDPDRSTWVASAPTDLPWQSTPEVDLAYARYEMPWSDETINGTVHERWMAFRKRQDAGRPYWLIRDRLSRDGDAAEHVLRTLFHFYPGADLTLDERTGTATVMYPSGVGVALVFSDASTVKLDAAIGREDPVRGWYSEEYGKIDPAWELAAERRAGFPTEYAVVLVPFRADEVPDVRVEHAGGVTRVMVDSVEWQPEWPISEW